MELELVVLLVEGVDWVEDVVLEVLLGVVVEDVVLEVLLEVVEEEVVLDEVEDELLDDVVLFTAATYMNVVTEELLVPRPPHVAFTVYVPEIQFTVPPATITPEYAPVEGSTGSF